MWRGVAIGWAWVLAGCFNPQPAPGLECTSDGRCPAGQDCVDGVCEGTPQPDAMVSGGRPDAPPGTPDSAPPGGPDAAVGAGAGDLCGTAIPVTSPGSYPGTLAGATDNYDPPGGPCANVDGVEIIYRLTLNAPTGISISVDTMELTGKWYAHTTCPPVGTQSCGGISPQGGGSTTVTYPAGTSYIVIERSSMSAGASFTLTIE